MWGLAGGGVMTGRGFSPVRILAIIAFLIAFLIIFVTVPAAAQAPHAKFAQAVLAGQKAQLRFAQPVAYDSGGLSANSVAIADLNGDGVLDLVVANGQQIDGAYGEVAVLLGNGDGTFQSAVTYSTGAYGAGSVAVGDVNGDGIPVVAQFELADLKKVGKAELHG